VQWLAAISVGDSTSLGKVQRPASQVSAVIVRPDRYVYAGAGDADQLNMLVARLMDALRGR